MRNIFLSIAPNPDKLDGNYYFESIGEALIYALIGFLVVLVGIVLIICIIWLIGFIMRKTNNLEFLSKIRFKKHKRDKVEEPTIEQDVEEDIPDEVKVAIVAALMTYYSEEKPKCEFKVKKINRI